MLAGRWRVPGYDLDLYLQQFVGEVSFTVTLRIPLEGPEGQWVMGNGDRWSSPVLSVFTIAPRGPILTNSSKSSRLLVRLTDALPCDCRAVS